MSRAPAVLRGRVRDYDWGVVDGMQSWGVPADGGPHAELWFGCHPAAPSPLRDDPGRTLLDVWGPGSTPLLTKILAAARPLSLQVHPRAELIASWDGDKAAERLLADHEEKTEMLVAVEPFTCLADWQEPGTAARLLAAAGAAPEVLAALTAAGPKAAAALLLGDHRLELAEQQWLRAARAAELSDVEFDAIDQVAAAFDRDPGVAVAALLRPVLLAPGDAVFVPAGVPHAYVHGLGVEVMTSSDNVLRLGLTSKTVAVPYALASLDAERAAVVATAPPSGRYNIVGAPFSVSFLTTPDRLEADEGAYRLVLALEGGCEVTVGSQIFPLAVGDALAVPARAPTAATTTSGRAVVVRATR